jgi:hypothetical protein
MSRELDETAREQIFKISETPEYKLLLEQHKKRVAAESAAFGEDLDRITQEAVAAYFLKYNEEGAT